MKATTINAAEARAMFPKVIGTINGAELHSGYAILDMGPRAYAVMIAGEWRACCPSRKYAKAFGERYAFDAVNA